MNEHTEIRDLLTLAAAGALNADEQRRVEKHLRECPACRAEFDSWQQLTSALSKLPTPEAPAGMVERTRRQLINQAAVQKERRWNHLVMGCLILFGWALTFLSWPVLQVVGDKLASWLNIPFTTVTLILIAYTLAAWIATGVVAAFIGKRFQQEGRAV